MMDTWSEDSDLDSVARAILMGNDRGGFTVPTAGLYPFQWNWDSALTALGIATYDLDRAWREIETLFLGQWGDGMVPHIVFHLEDPGYFPGPRYWGVDHQPRTSGYSQPPLAASVVRRLLERGANADAEARARALFAKIDRWHAWFFRFRRDPTTGAVTIAHPWESGRDNLPDWDAPMAAVDSSAGEPVWRSDLEHVEAAQRPSHDDYARYMALVGFGRDRNWESSVIGTESPFWVADPGMTAILLRAERDLMVLADRLVLTERIPAIRSRVGSLERGLEGLWSEKAGAYCSRDLRAGTVAEAVNSATFLAFYAGLSEGPRAGRLRDHFDRIADRVRFTLPSYDPDDARFEPRRYWRGPTWIMVNRLIALGLEEGGDGDRSERLRRDSAALIRNAGFREYYDPVTGDGYGGGRFSWTAAMWLDWAGRGGTDRAADD